MAEVVVRASSGPSVARRNLFDLMGDLQPGPSSKPYKVPSILPPDTERERSTPLPWYAPQLPWVKEHPGVDDSSQ